MKYNFIKYECPARSYDDHIRVTKHGLLLNKTSLNRLNCSSVDVFYDTNEKVINIIKGNYRKVTISNGVQGLVSLKGLSNLIPVGNYTFDEVDGYYHLQVREIK